MSGPLVGSPGVRAHLRAGGCVVAACGGLVALYLSPGLITTGDPIGGLRVVQAGLLSGVLAMLIVAAGNLLGPSRLPRMRALARSGTWWAITTMVGYLAVAAFVVTPEVRAVALPLAPVVLSLCVAAVILGVVTTHLDDATTRRESGTMGG
ncbi:hypothetical protein [Nocardioides nanhaiensis]|uniref:Uncharacterized protein n=1 Tax=Nocardioides nanhaiensis TaxID=1476871 RepID=A0ABP8VYB4_9ACTN